MRSLYFFLISLTLILASTIAHAVEILGYQDNSLTAAAPLAEAAKTVNLKFNALQNRLDIIVPTVGGGGFNSRCRCRFSTY